MTEAEIVALAMELDIWAPQRDTDEYAMWRQYVVQAWKARQQRNKDLALILEAKAEEICLQGLGHD